MAWDDSKFYKQDKGKWFIKRKSKFMVSWVLQNLYHTENSSCPNDSGRITNIS